MGMYISDSYENGQVHIRRIGAVPCTHPNHMSMGMRISESYELGHVHIRIIGA